jgi:hypothetical protein
MNILNSMGLISQNSILQLLNSLVGLSNLQLNIQSKNAYATTSLLQYGNDANPNHLGECSITTKMYQLCHTIKLNGLAKSKFHQQPKPMMGNNHIRNVSALNDTHI